MSIFGSVAEDQSVRVLLRAENRPPGARTNNVDWLRQPPPGRRPNARKGQAAPTIGDASEASACASSRRILVTEGPAFSAPIFASASFSKATKSSALTISPRAIRATSKTYATAAASPSSSRTSRAPSPAMSTKSTTWLVQRRRCATRPIPFKRLRRAS
jgi:hypothetical protein